MPRIDITPEISTAPLKGATGHLPSESELNSQIRLRRARGQLLGIEKMISEKRDYQEILTQFRAVYSALQAVEHAVFENHLRSGIKVAVTSKNLKSTEKKLDELVNLVLERRERQKLN